MYPDSADAYGWRGLAYLRADRPQSAVDDLSRAIELEPTVGEYYAHRARALTKIGLAEQAQRDMGAVAELGLDPDFVTAALESSDAFESSFSISSTDPVPPPLPTLASPTNEIPTDLDGTWRGATTLAGVIELTIEDNRVQSVTLEECFGVVSHSFPYNPPRDVITAGAFSLTEDPFILRGTFSSENQASGLVEFALVPPCGTVRSVPWDAVKLPAAGPGQWSSAGDTAEARASHTATLLRDGTVLVVGGRSESDRALSTAEVYEPASGTWSATGSMEHPRVSHVAVPLRNGTVLVVGGTSDSGTPLASVEFYDPSTESWIPASAMAEPRHFHTATLLGDGRVLVAGGLNEDNDVLASTELFDPVENVWSTASDLPTPRFSHTSVLLSDGRVLSVGGADASFQIIPSADVFDPSTSEWTSAGDTGLPRISHTITQIGNGRALAAGGFHVSVGSLNQAQEFRPILGVWFGVAPLAIRRGDHTATLMDDGTVLVLGGVVTGASEEPQMLSSTEVYLPKVGLWFPGSSMIQGRSSHTATLLNDGSVLVAGGFAGSGRVIASAELYRR